MNNNDVICPCIEHKCNYKHVGLIEKIMTQEQIIYEQQHKLESFIKKSEKIDEVDGMNRRKSNWKQELSMLYKTPIITDGDRKTSKISSSNKQSNYNEDRFEYSPVNSNEEMIVNIKQKLAKSANSGLTKKTRSIS